MPLVPRWAIATALSVLAGCAGGGGVSPGAPGPPAAPAGRTQTAGPSSTLRSAAAALSRPAAHPSPAPQSLCIGGTQYQTVQDDEFSQDSTLSLTNSDFIYETPAPNGAIWSSRANGFANGGTRNNIGIDDAFYTNATIKPHYNPFSLTGGTLNIRTEPIPAKLIGAPAYDGAHWFSGLLEGPALTYGYVEVSAEVPNLQGYWPAPLWLLGLYGDDGQGNGYEELDAAEIFGNSLGTGVVQQTQVFSQNDTPPHNYVREYVPTAGKAFHTYGVLWTPSTVSYYVDRQPTSPAYPNAANGPANPIIILQVFAASYGGALPPAKPNPQTEHLQYYRWYQTNGGSCSPTAVATPPVAYPTPTPGPAMTPVPGAPVITQNSGVFDYAQSAPLAASFVNPPATNDVLIAIIVATSGITTPPGWTQIDGVANQGGFQLYAAPVDANGVAPATTYSFGTNTGVIELLDVSGVSTTSPGVVGKDPDFPELTNTVRTVAIPRNKGLLLSIWSGVSNLPTGFEALEEQLPANAYENVLTYSLNNPVGANSTSLRVSEALGEPFSAPHPYTVVGSSAVLGDWFYDGVLLWLDPVGGKAALTPPFR
jgi:hypothetical protein